MKEKLRPLKPVTQTFGQLLHTQAVCTRGAVLAERNWYLGVFPSLPIFFPKFCLAVYNLEFGWYHLCKEHIDNVKLLRTVAILS